MAERTAPPVPDDLAQLRRDHPERWKFRATTAGGRVLLVGEHDEGALISAGTRAGLERKIALVDGR